MRNPSHSYIFLRDQYWFLGQGSREKILPILCIKHRNTHNMYQIYNITMVLKFMGEVFSKKKNLKGSLVIKGRFSGKKKC